MRDGFVAFALDQFEDRPVACCIMAHLQTFPRQFQTQFLFARRFYRACEHRLFLQAPEVLPEVTALVRSACRTNSDPGFPDESGAQLFHPGNNALSPHCPRVLSQDKPAVCLIENPARRGKSRSGKLPAYLVKVRE